jgi:hypothetical protein
MVARARKRSLTSATPARSSGEVVPLRTRRAGLFIVHVLSCDGDRRRARVSFPNGEQSDARLSAVLDVAVVETAIRRDEVVLAEEDSEGIVLLGALRTSATPGLEQGEEFRISAKRLILAGEHELSLRAGAAQVVLRAVGMVETIARDITSRAAGVHKIVGRMLHLN